MNELALFAGAGGGILGGRLLGWRTVCAVERDAYAAAILAQRQNDETLPIFPIWSDVCSFDGRPWRGIVDVVSGGFPCQDISVAGAGEGIEGARSGLWKEMHRIVGDIRPEWVFVENSPALTSRGLGTVLGDLAEIGYDAEWMCLSAAQCGAHHIRNRIWILANANSARELQPTRCEQERGYRVGDSRKNVYNPYCDGFQKRNESARRGKGSDIAGRGHKSDVADPDGDACVQGRQSNPQERPGGRIFSGGSFCTDVAKAGSQRFPKPKQKELCGSRWRQEGRTTPQFGIWPAEPDVGRVVDGVAFRVDQIRALGNGQVPRVAAAAFVLLQQRFQTKQ